MRSRRRRDDGQEGAGLGRGVAPPLAVLVFPSELIFYWEQSINHRRVLTIYNPYSFSLHYKMWSTAPSLYRVVEAEGNIRAKSCLDLVVRHLDVSPGNRGRRDWFRLEVRGGGQVAGREIWAELRGGGEEEKGRRGALPPPPPSSPLSPLLVPTHTHRLRPCTAVHSLSQWVLCVLVAVLCVTVLLLPLHTDTSSLVPPCLHVSTNQKLACAYTLGLLTVVFLR